MTPLLSRRNTRCIGLLKVWHSTKNHRQQISTIGLLLRLDTYGIRRTAFPLRCQKINTNSFGTQGIKFQRKLDEDSTSFTSEKEENTGCFSETNSQIEALDLPGLDQKWQKRWQARLSTTATHTRGHKDGIGSKSYILPMFPYPSGSLHMGHVRVYTIADVLARWKGMTGHDVLNPMGWDAFGLPAENAAIEKGLDPAKWTEGNIVRMKELLKTMNTNIKWEMEFSTCDPAFYKHTQKLFLLLWQHGLVYQAKGMVNWDPVDKTVLANEQVDKDGRSWRSGAKVRQKLLTQWFVRVTAFQEALLEDMDILSTARRWPQRVLAMQRNWIGRSKGARFKFMVGARQDPLMARRPVEVFTTRPDTLFGVQYIALSTSHPVISERLEFDEGLRQFLSESKSMSLESKQGYRLTGIDAVNPSVFLDGAPSDVSSTVPVYVAPYVLDSYGEGAVMGVPGHDDRDFAFWSTNSPQQSIRYVVNPSGNKTSYSRPFTKLGELNENCGKLKGLCSKEAGQRIVAELCQTGNAKEAEIWRLRDWLISRQRYWGTPIPIIHCDSCGAIPVPDNQLPVRLPELSGDWFKGKTGNPLQSAKDWQDVLCPNCGRASKRDTDTMDTFVDSSWYFMRFPDSGNESQPFSVQSANRALPVDIYIGGIEHAILHLLYARFMSKFLAKIGLWPRGKEAAVKGEPFHTLISQGMVHGKTYTEPQTGRFLRPEELDLTSPSDPRILGSSRPPDISFQKMSKSKHNGVDPSKSIGKFGADVVRAHILFAAPVTDILEWDEAKIVGTQRWLGRLWRHVQLLKNELDKLDQHELESILRMPFDSSRIGSEGCLSWVRGQENLRRILDSYATTSLNTLISDLMKLTQEVISSHINDLFLSYHLTSILLRAMAPVTPAFAEECWELLHNDLELCLSIFDEEFPSLDQTVNKRTDMQTCAVQQNGKLKFTTEIPVMPPEVSEPTTWILERLGETKRGSKWLNDNVSVSWKRIVIVKAGKTINFVGS